MSNDWKHRVDITGVDLRKLLIAAFDVSVPRGMGFLHHREEPLSDAEAESVLSRNKPDSYVALNADYVRGRAVKLTVWRDRDTGSYYTRPYWFDHDQSKLAAILREAGVANPEAKIAEAIRSNAERDAS